ncbi:MAG: hypothetical protein ACRDOD_18520 [Streptosporangiaceae bacterium]
MRELRRERLAVTAAFFGFGVLPGVWAARIPSVQDARGLSVGVLGAALIAPAASAIAAIPAAGGVASRIGRRAVFRAALMALCVSAPLLAWAPGLTGFVVALLVWGASSGALDVALNAEAVDIQQRYGRSVLTGMHAFWSLGAFAGAGLAAAAAAAAASGSGAFFLALSLALVLIPEPNPMPGGPTT